MTRTKTNLTQFSLWQYFAPHLNPLIKNAELDRDVNSSEIVAIMTIAVEPSAMVLREAAEIGKVFWRAYASFPDFTIEMLRVCRAEWLKNDDTSEIKKFLALNPPEAIIRNGVQILDTKDQSIAADLTALLGRNISSENVKSARQSFTVATQGLIGLSITPETAKAIDALKATGLKVSR